MILDRFRIDDQVAIVTGASRGLGAAIAVAFAEAGGDVVIAAITSCTNTSNPNVLMAAGLVAKKAHELGLKPKPWVKTSLAPGSQVVAEYLEAAGLQSELDALGFNLVGFGCTTCIGNSGPLPDEVSAAINENDLAATAVLSGNRNFEGRQGHKGRTHLVSPAMAAAVRMAVRDMVSRASVAATVGHSLSTPGSVGPSSKGIGSPVGAASPQAPTGF